MCAVPPLRTTALLVGIVATAIYLVTLQQALFGDGIYLLSMLEQNRPYAHVLYLPIVRTVAALVGCFMVVDAELAMKITSALAGGAMVAAIGVVVGRALQPSLALAAGLLSIGLYGVWFHSTATELHAVHGLAATLTFGLLLAVLQGKRVSPRVWLLLVAGLVFTCGTHLTGAMVALPVLVVAVRQRGAMWPVFSAALVAAVVFGAIYTLAFRGDAGVAGHATNHLDKAKELLRNYAYLPYLWKGCVAEWALYSVPVSTLVPAGLWVMFRRQRALFWLCLAWLVAWPLMAWPIEDRMFGAYYVPTYPAQVLVALCALSGVGVARCLVALPLAFAPQIALLLEGGEAGALWTLLGSALGLLVLLAGGGEPRRLSSAIWLFVFLAVAGSGWVRWQGHAADPVRREIHHLDESLNDQDVVLLTTVDITRHEQWMRFFPNAKTRVFNPNALDYPPPGTADVAGWRAEWRQRLRHGVRVALAGRHRVVVVGPLQHPAFGVEARKTLGALAGRLTLVPETVAGVPVHRLQR